MYRPSSVSSRLSTALGWRVATEVPDDAPEPLLAESAAPGNGSIDSVEKRVVALERATKITINLLRELIRNRAEAKPRYNERSH